MGFYVVNDEPERENMGACRPKVVSAEDGASPQQEQEDAAPASAVDRALSKAGWRLIPLCMGIAISNHMDRSK